MQVFNFSREIIRSDGATSIEEIQEAYPSKNFNTSSINVYPNPAQSKVSFDVPGNSDFLLYIYNGIGQIVYSGKENPNQLIDISNLDDGIYYYTVSVADEWYRGSMIIN